MYFPSFSMSKGHSEMRVPFERKYYINKQK